MDNLWLMERARVEKYLTNRKDALSTDPNASFVEDVQKDLDSSFDILTVDADSDTATVAITGTLTEKGSDLWDAITGDLGTSYARIREVLQEADSVLSDKGIIYIDFNTPGGTVEGVESTSRVIKEIVDSGRKVKARVGSLCASAGMWLASSCSDITAGGRTSLLGSIGVAVQVMDYTKALDDYGIAVYNLTNDESKDKRPDISTEEGRSVIKKELNDLYEIFISDVISGRQNKVNREDIEKLNGRVILAEEALSIKLIDNIEILVSNKKDEGEKVSMTLEEFLKSNSEAQAELKNLLVAEKEKAVKAEQEKNAKLGVFLTSDYPDAVKAVVAKGLAGERSIEAVEDFIALYDATHEKAESKDAVAEQPEETPTEDAAVLEKEQGRKSFDDRLAKIRSL